MNRFSIIFGALTFVSTLAGGLFAVRYRERFGILAAFAAGVLIAVSLFDLLPEALRLATTAGGFLYLGAADLLPQAHEKDHPLVSIAFTLLGFLLIFVITGLLGV
jgi:zinc transporter ZupT